MTFDLEYIKFQKQSFAKTDNFKHKLFEAEVFGLLRF